MIETPAHTHRTPGQTRRRRALRNAAAGHTSVVLYLCSTDEGTAVADAVAILRRYAAARDWVVSEVIIDASPLTAPLATRDQWTAVRDAITDCRAEGIITLRGHTHDGDEPPPAALTEWLGALGAFLAVADVTPRPSHPHRAAT